MRWICVKKSPDSIIWIVCVLLIGEYHLKFDIVKKKTICFFHSWESNSTVIGNSSHHL